MANSFAYLMLVCWPLVTLVLFRRLPLPQALCWSVVAGYLLLPVRAGWNFPMIPTIDKTLIIGLSAAIMGAIMARQDKLAAALPGLRTPPSPYTPAARMAGGLARQGHAGAPATIAPGPRRPGRGHDPQPRGRWLIYGLLVLLVLTPMATVMANGEPVRWGSRTLPGLQMYDALSIIARSVVNVLPFVLAMVFLRTHERHVILLRVLAIAGALYAGLALFEVRMSPQISIWVYGYFPHNWLQHVRGGFRPVVFLQHGLWLGVFLGTATLAACVLWRQAIADRIASRAWLWTALWLGGVLLLSRNLGATFLVLVLAPVIVLTGLRTQAIVAATIAGIVLSYPVLRSAGVVPTQTILSGFARIDAERADSLLTRITNEDRMLAHANDKPLTGWGGYGRNRVYDERGRNITITDGAWIIILGTFGWFGYIAQFGLLTLPMILLALRRREEVTTATAGLMLIAALGLIDLLPNATLTPVTWLIGGAVAGRYLLSVQPVAQDPRRPLGAGPGWGGVGPKPALTGGITGPRGQMPGMAFSAPRTGPGMGAAPMNGTRMNGTMMPGGQAAAGAVSGSRPGPAAAHVAGGPPRHQRRPRG